MFAYAPSVKDTLFTLYHTAGFQRVADIPSFAEAAPDLVEAMLVEGARLASEMIAPLNAPGDREGAQWHPEGVKFPSGYRDAWRALGEGGWMSLPFDPEFGGQGMPMSLFNVLAEWVPAASLGFAQTLTLTASAIEALTEHASPEIQARFIPKMTSGQWTGTMNLTEPQAGSDVGALTTSAVAMPDGTFRIKGQKIYITSGEHDMTENIVHLVLARLEGAPSGTAGISLFLVPKRRVLADGTLGPSNDVQCTSIEKKLGIHGSATCVMVYGDHDDCEGLLIGEPNRGMAAMFTMMNAARVHVGLQGLGCAERAYQGALDWATQRVQGVPVGSKDRTSRPIIEHADVRRMLMDMRVKIEVARAICYRASVALDLARHHPDPNVRAEEKGVIDLLTPMAKAYATDIGCEVASEAVQIFGGMGFVEETGAAQIYRDVRITPIYEGTNGIQAWDLSHRKLKAAGGAHWRAMLAEITYTTEQLRKHALDPLAAPLEAAVEAVQTVADWFVERHVTSPRDVAGGSVGFLRLFSETVGAHLLARGALVAHQQKASGSDPAFLESRIVFARYFVQRHLPLSVSRAT
ncbi:MAG: acyl-CoA dehydrogenase family protein, partial [Myxococcota bacterium]